MKNPNEYVEVSKEVKTAKKVITIIVTLIIALILLGSSATSIKTGYTGVVTTFGKASTRTLDAGFHFKLPFVQDVISMNNQVQLSTIDTDCVSKDLQSVGCTIAVNYRLPSDKSYDIYTTIGTGYSDVILLPAVQESLKAVMSKYTAEELITSREIVSQEFYDNLSSRVSTYGLYIEKTNIVNFNFSDEFNKAIEDKQVAEQNLIKTKTEQEQAIVIAKAEAEKKTIQAEANATAILKEANAKAEANKLLQSSLTAMVLEQQKIEKWDGVMPKVITSDGDSASLLIDIGTSTDTTTTE